MTYLNIAVMFLHIGSAIAWIGGIVYLRHVLLPVLMQQAPNVRGPVVADLGPRSVRFLLRAGEITIATGLVNFFLMGSMEKAKLSPVWGASITLGFFVTLAIYILGQAVTRPVTLRMAEVIRTVMAGSGGPEAPAQLEALAARQRQMLGIQLALGTFVVLLMAVARFF